MGGRLVDAQELTLDDIGVEPDELLGDDRNDWNSEGVIRLPGFFTATESRRLLLERYASMWVSENIDAYQGEANWGGWQYPTPYMEHPEILDLMEALWLTFARPPFNEAFGTHLNLTGWISTQRDWHADQYLNPTYVGDHYAAVWIALDDIDPDSGVFQYVPGSHRWPQVTRNTCWSAMEHAGLDVDPHTWPTESEKVLSPLFEREIAARDAEVVSYVPSKGDVLIWHGRLLHRGSKPTVPGAERPAIITHLSGIEHRPDMPPPQRWRDGQSWYFPIDARGGRT